MTYNLKTLAQNIDIDSLIALEAISAVNEDVRAAADDVLSDGLIDEFEQIFEFRAEEVKIFDVTPEEFMSYDVPEAPVITELEPAEEIAENSQEAPIVDEDETPDGEIEKADVDIVIPDFADIQVEAPPIQDDIVIEIPPIARVNADLRKVNMDTLWFDKKFKTNLRLVVIIAAIVVAEAVLIVYLLHI